MLSVPAQEVVDAMLEIELELIGDTEGDLTHPEDSNDLDDLTDLDSLLNESVKLSQAKRDKALGRKLKADQTAVLSAYTIAQHELVWEPIAAIAHYRETICACGEVTRVFDGWFLYERHRRQVGSIRLARLQTTVPADIPQFEHSSERTVGECACCLPPMRIAKISDFPAIAELGIGQANSLAQGELF